ncbi:MAG: hypothetical protein JWR38_5243 [Mucilaginibacter sp.]|nr:hypothetical protein [Mucilaginibacter sp.]
MAEIGLITDGYIDEVIKSSDVYDLGLNKALGVKLRELVKLFRACAKQKASVFLTDTFNPGALDLTYHEDMNLRSWPPTANKGSYYLFRQNEQERIYTAIPSDTGEMTYTLPVPWTCRMRRVTAFITGLRLRCRIQRIY